MSNNCPFYGCAMFRPATHGPGLPFVLVPTMGNQCALVADSHAPCHMEINGLPVDWKECPVAGDLYAMRREI